MRYGLVMDKKVFLDRLQATGTNQAQMCRDIGVYPTTPMRWKEAPQYAVAYLLAIEAMDKRQRLEFRHQLALQSAQK